MLSDPKLANYSTKPFPQGSQGWLPELHWRPFILNLLQFLFNCDWLPSLYTAYKRSASGEGVCD